MSKRFWFGLLGALILLAGFCTARPDQHELEWGGLQRHYLLHVPKGLSGPAPLVVALHGGGGNARGFERWTKFSELADREKFLVVYPDGVGKNWNDGRQDVQAEAFQKNIDDVGFLRAVVEDVARRHPVDRRRIYATGASNGGFMSSRLGIEASDLLAAIAPVIGGIPAALPTPAPARPVAVLIVQGTQDPLVPYAGGLVAGNRGRSLSTEEALRFWCEVNGCTLPPRVEALVDRDPADGCRVEHQVFGEGRVQLYRIEGGGHTWPGRAQYLPERFIGKTCRDFDATETIWSFFKEHPSP